MVPLLIGAGVAALFGASGVAAAKDMQKEAERTLDNARSTYDNAKTSLEAQQKITEHSLESLGKDKYDILTTLIPQFVIAFDKFKNVDFRNSAGINELDNLKIEKFCSSDFADIRQLADTTSSLKEGALAGGAAGAVIALGAGTVAVDTLLGAGTIGWAASSLGVGAAADLALAGIGGLVPGLAIVAGPALLIGGFASCMKADENLEKAKAALVQAEEAAEKMETAECLCSQIEKRSDMFIELLSNLRPLLERSITELNRISGETYTINVTKRPPLLFQFIAGLLNIQLKDKIVTKRVKKSNYNNLNNEEKAFLAMSGAIAKAVKSVLDTPILDSDGNVTYKSEELYETLEEKVPIYEKQQHMLLTKIR